MERSGTVDKALRTLELLHGASEPLALADIAKGLDMPKATVHRLLASLSAHEMVEQDPQGRYGLGVGLLRLGLGAQARDPVVRVARPHLEEAARAFQETFFLVVARAGRLVVIDKVEGTGILRAAPDIGGEVPVAETASGRLYLAHDPSLVRISKADAQRVKEDVARAKRRGYDLNESAWIDGLAVVAAPILVSDRMVGSVACAMVATRWDKALSQKAIEHVVDAARRTASALSG